GAVFREEGGRCRGRGAAHSDPDHGTPEPVSVWQGPTVASNSRRTRTNRACVDAELPLANFAKQVRLGREEVPMATMNISLADDMKAFIEDEAARRGFGTVSEYVRAIIRDVQARQAERDRLDAILIEGLDSGPATPLTKEDWEHIRREGKKLV